MSTRILGLTICGILVLVLSSWGSDTTPKGFHTSAPHRRDPLAQAGHGNSSGSLASQTKSNSEREKEVQRLEQQNVSHLQAPSRQRSAKSAAVTPHTQSQPKGQGSGINFGYHPPSTQSARTSGNRKR